MSKPINLKEISKVFESKLKKIKVCLFDVDGILTNGKHHYFDILESFG